MRYLNLGCGKKFIQLPEWLNADMVPLGEGVMQCNFLDGIPFENKSFNLVYHSHVLEHFSRKDGEKFIRECYRILRPGGVLRIALPDLKVIASEYLKNLDRIAAGEKAAEADYDWMMLEMYDQTVRNHSGGEMLDYLNDENKTNAAYISNRVGNGGDSWQSENKPAGSPADTFTGKFRKALKKPSLVFDIIREKWLQLFLSKKNFQYYKTGKFRKGGEIHQWMYDSFSMERLLKKAGFDEVIVQNATSSKIENWAGYRLDDPHESASLFIEAVK
jgi:predicted SAM-dependent methyltransferase